MEFARLSVILLLASAPAWGAPRGELETAPSIPDGSIALLQREIAAIEDVESTVEKRRACKRIVRRAESLVEKSPDSPDRSGALGIMFEAQKIMFTMRQSAENSEALIETAKKLLEAPDEYAGLRVEPDMMLVQMQLSGREDSPNVAALEIARFADRYRGTPAEARSLMMAATAAQQDVRWRIRGQPA